jgi:hypothetical protein
VDRTPFSIYVDARPLKVAFLLDPSTNSWGHLDAVLEYCTEKWGGRFHAVALTDGVSLREPYWALLEEVDPDVLVSLTTLTSQLAGELERRLTPFFMEELDAGDGSEPYRVDIPRDGLSILPTAHNVRRCAGSNALVVDFELSADAEPNVEAFVRRSLGRFSRVHVVRRALAESTVKSVQVSDTTSLAAALRELTSFQGHAYPVQVCAVPNHLPETEHHRYADVCTVFVGDTMEDVTAYWNNIFGVRRYLRPVLMQTWLPTSFLGDETLRAPLAAWLTRLADPHGTMNKSIRFASRSLTEDRLREALEPLSADLRIPSRIFGMATPEAPKFARMPWVNASRRSSAYHRGAAVTEHLVLDEPDVDMSGRGNECWVADFHVEHKSPDFTDYIREFWWQLPPRNSVVASSFNLPARVQRSGFPSVLVERGSPHVRVTSTSDRDVFAALALPARYEKRGPAIGDLFGGVRHSDKGQYFRGFVQIFGGLSPAFQVLENRFWRNTLAKLAKGTASDEPQVAAIRNRLAKESLAKLDSDEAREWLAQFVMQQARNVPHEGREVLFSTIRRDAEAEFAEFASSPQGQGRGFEFDDNGLRRTLAELVASGAMQLGLKPKCPGCGYRIWYHLDDSRQRMPCKGCGCEFALRPEEPWRYRLNSLVEAGIARHGLVPLVLVLGQLMHRSMSGFLYDVGVQLHEDPDGPPVAEVDVMAAVDGRFMLGEVKQSNGLFKQDDFEQAAKVAERLRPHEVFFSSLEPVPSSSIKRNIESLRKRLSSHRVEVSWRAVDPGLLDASPNF